MQIGGRQATPAYLLNTLKPGHVIEGPAILIDDISTDVVEPECTAYITAGQDIRIEVPEWPLDTFWTHGSDRQKYGRAAL